LSIFDFLPFRHFFFRSSLTGGVVIKRLELDEDQVLSRLDLWFMLEVETRDQNGRRS